MPSSIASSETGPRIVVALVVNTWNHPAIAERRVPVRYAREAACFELRPG